MNFSFCALSGVLNETIFLYQQKDLNASSFTLDEPSSETLQEWTYLPHSSTKMFLIPPVLCLMAAILVIPFILFVIFSHVDIRRETRYLLLGNALFCDLMYLILYTISEIFSTSNYSLPINACGVLLFLLAMTFCGGLLTAVAMVLDTYLAILWPLHYISILPSSRAKKLVLFLWISSGIFPGIIFFVLQFTQKPTECTVENCSVPIILILTLHGNSAAKSCYALSIAALFLCLFLIFFCYLILCFKTKQAGIWKSIFSRASVTFLMHHIILFFHFSPLLAVVVESLLYTNEVIGPKTGIWVSLIICNVLIILPKALSPYLCGLRYREITASLKFFLGWRRTSVVCPASLA